MGDGAEPLPAGSLPLPPRPDAEVLAPRLRPRDLRRELERLEAERASAQRELGALVVGMSREGALAPATLADRSAALRSLEQQIEAVVEALGGERPAETSGGTRRASILAALVAVAVIGGIAGAAIERRQADPSPTPVTVPTVITETVTTR